MKTLLLLTISLLLFSCKTLKKDTTDDENKIKTEATSMQKIELSKIEGKTFYWTNTKYSDGSIISPKEKSSYIIFAKGGKMKVQSDCNTGSSTFTIDNYDLKVSPILATKKGCFESTEKKFFSGLTDGTKIYTKDNKLYIDLKLDSGTMEFISE